MTEAMAIGAAIAAVKNFVDLVGQLGDGVYKEAISQLYRVAGESAAIDLEDRPRQDARLDAVYRH